MTREMNERDQERVDGIRRRSSEVRNHLIDQYEAGGISRREFIRRGTVAGMSLPALAFLAAACGGSEPLTTGPSGDPPVGGVRPGGTVRTALIPPSGALDPVTVDDEGGLAILGQSGEYLSWSNADLELEPRIAEGWEANEDNSVWTFQIRQGVKYHDGTDLTTEDVAATMDRLADPDSRSNALSAFGGVLSKGNTRALDRSTVEFTLDAPNGNFPYLVSSDNYNAIILPASFDGSWEESFIGTGPWKLESYMPGVGVTYTRNPDYWDPSRLANPDTNEIRFFADEAARVAALQGGEVDVISHYSVSGGQVLLTDPNVTTLELRSSVHRQIHMRTDQEPFTDKRARQALAIALDREAIVRRLYQGKADIGNDSPFAPVFPSTDPSAPQRSGSMEQARQLIIDAGVEGAEVQLDTWNGFEIPDLAVQVQRAGEEIGLSVRLNVTDQATYYGQGVPGSSPWLDSTLGITDYGHRGVPNLLLEAPLSSDGVWNSARFENPAYDQLVAEYVAESDLESQRVVASQIQTLLLDETPVIFPYFYFFLTAVSSSFAGVTATAMGHVDLTLAGRRA